MSRILISGIPGTGKTTIGEYMAQELDFHHVDMDAGHGEPIFRLEDNQAAFLGELATHPNVVITWGFKPFHYYTQIKKIVAEGYQPFWLDGDRVAAFRSFMGREKHDDTLELNFHVQMQMIIATGIVEKLEPTIVNTFQNDGQFRPVEDITQEIINQAATASHT